MTTRNYWQRMRRNKMSRRSLLRASARAGVGAAGLALVGCGGGDNDDGQEAAAQGQLQTDAGSSGRRNSMPVTWALETRIVLDSVSIPATRLAT